MKTTASIVGLACLLSPAVMAQTAASSAGGSTHSFTLKAPNAKEVLIRGLGKEPVAFKRDAQGVWTGSVAGLRPGLYEYSFVVDGLTIVDPANPTVRPSRTRQVSVLEVPSNPPAVWDEQDVPRGTLHRHAYRSKALGKTRVLWVYTPPGYDAASPTKYPVLVLLHAHEDNERTWIDWGKADRILDNAIAAKKARPMVVMMPDAHPLGLWKGNDPVKRDAAVEAFRRDLVEDALPLLEARYRVEKTASRRAIAGLSCGNGQSLTLTTGLRNLDHFGWIGAFAADAAAPELVKPALADAAATNAKLRLLWMPIGKDDFLLKVNTAFSEMLTAHGIKHQRPVTDGSHSWALYRQYLGDFTGMIFREGDMTRATRRGPGRVRPH